MGPSLKSIRSEEDPDTCSGTGECVVNHEPTTVLCREDAGECDVLAYCDAAGECPANGFEPSGTACGNPGDTVCDDPDTCSGTGACVVNHEPTTVLCRRGVATQVLVGAIDDRQIYDLLAGATR